MHKVFLFLKVEIVNISEKLCNEDRIFMNQKIVAAFDFDGTLTNKDILIPFLQNAFGKFRVALSVVKLLPAIGLFCLGMQSRQQVKERFLSFQISGMDPTIFTSLATCFSTQHVQEYIRSDALEKLAWHQSQGHEVCIISANLAPLLIPYAQKIGVERIIATELLVDSQGKLTGDLKGNNCWGEEKVRRLLEVYGSKDRYILYAYGDSRGDKELLQLADYPYYRYFSK